MSILHWWVIPLIILSCVFSFALPSPGYGDDWVYVDKTDNVSVYYNKTNININRKTKQIKVWTKFTYTEKGKEIVINNRKDKELNITNYQSLSYSFELYFYDYNELKYRTLSIDDYTIEGDTLGSVNNSDIKLDDIIPESISGIILNKIFNDYKIKR
jgi:hypothetical protein